MRISSVFVVAYLAATTTANAHLGHVGEVAGHAHWIGIGAVIVAGALAAALGKGLEKPDEAESEEVFPEELEGEGEPA